MEMSSRFRAHRPASCPTRYALRAYLRSCWSAARLNHRARRNSISQSIALSTGETSAQIQTDGSFVCGRA
jgi:hypothetical protein